MAISLKSLLERRVPQIVGIYLGGSWVTIELMGWLLDRLPGPAALYPIASGEA